MSYEHRVHYYETDQMKVVHHSNYIRWFEEARTAWMEEHGCPYVKMEEYGIISPVLEVQAKYRTMTHFGDTVVIEVSIKKYTGIKLIVSYQVKDKATGEVRCTGESKHCFLNSEGKLVRLDKVAQGFDEMFKKGIISD